MTIDPRAVETMWERFLADARAGGAQLDSDLVRQMRHGFFSRHDAHVAACREQCAFCRWLAANGPRA